MEYQLLSLSDEEARNGPLEGTFDRRLQRCLNEKIRIVGLRLREEQEASNGLLDWLEAWTREFREARCHLIVIPSSAGQFEALELSHPEQMLSYFSSLDEWGAAYPEKPEHPVPPTASHHAVPLTPAQQAHEVSDPAPQPAAAAEAFEQREPPATLPALAVGMIVEISGEYACAGCGAQRTWLKGDSIEGCDNVECLEPDAGWKLICDLF